jgi:hypothetical protein
LRQIIKTHLFEMQLRDLIKAGAKAADEFIEGLEFTLARRPEIGSLITTDDPPVWFVPTVHVDRVTPLAVYYTFDAESVYLLSIQVAITTDN